MIKDLLDKYSLKIEDLTAKGIDFSDISEDELEAKIIEAFEIEVKEEVEIKEEIEVKEDVEVKEIEEVEVKTDTEIKEDVEVKEDFEIKEDVVVDTEEVEIKAETEVKEELGYDEIKSQLEQANESLKTLNVELEGLREFKLNVEKANHEEEAQKLFSKFQLVEEDIEGLNVHDFSLEDIEEKCYAILGRKMAKKNFSKDEKKADVIKLKVDNTHKEEKPTLYGGLFEKYNK